MSSRRLPGLDALRGLAALWVVAHHALAYGMPYSIAADNGWLGVDVFFALSGYLLGMAHDRPRLLLPWLRKRAWRLLPLHALAFVAVVVPLWRGGYVTCGLLPALLLPGVALPGHAPLPAVVFWSLAVEWVGYLMLPLLARRWWGPWLVVALVPLLRVATWHVEPLWAYSAPWCRVDAMAWGLLAWRWRDSVPGWAAVASGAVGAGVACGWWLDPYGASMAGAGYTVTALAAAVLVVGVARLRWAPAWCCTVGGWSYALYLTHAVVLASVGWVAGVPLALLLAWALTRWVERPLADGYAARHASPVTASTSQASQRRIRSSPSGVA